MSFDNANLRPLAFLCKFFNKKMKFIDSSQRNLKKIDNFEINLFYEGVNLEKIQTRAKNCRNYLTLRYYCPISATLINCQSILIQQHFLIPSPSLPNTQHREPSTQNLPPCYDLVKIITSHGGLCFQKESYLQKIADEGR